MKKFAKFIAPMLGIACCAAMGIGSTYALFTSNDEVNIAVTAGKVDVTATLALTGIYTPASVNPTDYSIVDATNIATLASNATEGTFGLGGTAKVSATGNLDLDKVAPGDKVSAQIVIKNQGNVNAKYRYKMVFDTDSALYSAMNIDVNGQSYSGVSSYTSAWSSALAPDASFTLPLGIELPVEAGNPFQGLDTGIKFTVEAVQANAYTTEGEEIVKVDVKASTVAVTSEGKAAEETFIYESPIKDGDTVPENTVTLPENWVSADKAGGDVLLTVGVTEGEKEGSTFEVAGADVLSSIDLGLYVDGEKTTSFNDEAVTARIFIGKDLNNVSVYYAGEEHDNYSYDATTGYLTLVTTHFSEFVVMVQKDFWTEHAATIDLSQAEIEVSTAAELAAIAKAVNDGVSTFANKTVKVTADIDLDEYVWDPIGNSIAAYPSVCFSGDFDGGNYVISNMHAISKHGAYDAAGLFGTISEAVVKNVRLENFTVDTYHYAGAIAGYSSSETHERIENCSVKNGTVTSVPHKAGNEYDDGDKVGGIIGYITNGATITGNKVENVTVTAYRDLGGVVGCALGKATAAITNNEVKNCEIIQSNLHAYKSSRPTTVGKIVGRYEAEADASNVAINVTLSAK